MVKSYRWFSLLFSPMFLSTFSFAANTTAVPVDGPLLTFSDNFSDSQSLGEVEKWWEYATTNNMTWKFRKSTPGNQVMLQHVGGNHFIADQVPERRGILLLEIPFSIAGRDSSHTYLVTASQKFSTKTSDLFLVHPVQNRVTAHMKLSCADMPENPWENPATWMSDTDLNKWHNDIALSLVIKVEPGRCPDNKFVLVQGWEAPQELILFPPELSILTIRQ
ncbi:MAG TPA: hypothetical protein VE954_08925 [Oligoflexus sp.]|uniref:hypothetical protein n=1 Tax=Oligoflexus sp. TaxID=1971216 RepID=UPI002D67C24D|nr:hypothetical protein [Oligoflexus sp.]HYX33225.1 hypothetical protein [Oligoflexus sp.]